MRRLALLVSVLAALPLAGCGGSSKPRLWVTRPPRSAVGACVSGDCGPYAVTLNWDVFPAWGHTTSGYYVLLDGTHVAEVSARRYTFTGIDCGTTSMLGLQAHDGSGDHSGLVMMAYTSPDCPSRGAAPVNTIGPYFAASTVGSTPQSCGNGCAVVGQTLGVSAGAWTNSPTSYSYKWERCSTTSARPPTTASCSAISGATSSTYTVQSADLRDSLVPIVTAYKGGTASTPTSVSGSCDTGEMLGMTVDSFAATVPTAQPAGCSPISAVVATTQAGERFCTNAVTTCGYDDPLNETVGVPAGVTPSTTGACASYANGASISSGTVTINGCKITGQIYITGGTVMIENSNLSDADEEGAGAPIRAQGGNVTVSHDTIHGLNATTSGSIEWGMWDYGANAVTIDHVFFYNGDRLLMNNSPSAGTPDVTDSFCWSAAKVIGGNPPSESHYECIYTGPPSSITAKNDVFLNWRDQTAANYVDDNTGSCCGAVDLENNLLGGGSYTVYGGGPLVNSETLLDNRFSRAVNPAGGSLGAGAHNASSGFSQSGNIWDDTGTSVSR
jgi:hypothetical protein